jgi:hypothetical protein
MIAKEGYDIAGICMKALSKTTKELGLGIQSNSAHLEYEPRALPLWQRCLKIKIFYSHQIRFQAPWFKFITRIEKWLWPF